MGFIRCLILFTAALLLACCAPKRKPDPSAPEIPSRIQSVSFDDPLRIALSNKPIALRGARNEIVSFAIQLNELPPQGARDLALRIAPPPTLHPSTIRIYQVLFLPVDTNRASIIRHTGQPASSRPLPRALLPLSLEKLAIPISSLRDVATRPPVIWVDVHIPVTADARSYQLQCELIEGRRPQATLPIDIAVEEFILPDQRHLLLAGELRWPALLRAFPMAFGGIEPQLLSRNEPRHARAIQALDAMVKMAQEHRTQLVIPDLAPIVKWPSGSPPQIDFTDFDSIVSPWLKGDVFPDLVPLGYWPLPRPRDLEGRPWESQAQYWLAAASHFDQLDWLPRAPAVIPKNSPGRVSMAESLEISHQAAELLSAHPEMRVAVPLEEEQIQIASAADPNRIRPETLSRLLYAAPPCVSAQPLQKLPAPAAGTWLRTDLPGLVPGIGAGADEHEVRLWAWLAYLRGAQLVSWPSILPATDNPSRPADPEELVWFYPGSWFGVDQPLPSIQLKWMLRAEQDFEYLWLARQRGQGKRADLLARLIARPVEIPPAHQRDPVCALLCGTNDPKTWSEALDLLCGIIALNEPGQTIDPSAEKQLGYRFTTWSRAHEGPLLLGRSTQWARIRDSSVGDEISLRVGIDIYNAAEQQPERNQLHWSSVPEGWLNPAPPVAVPQLGTYSINRFFISTRIDAQRITPASRHPVTITFTDGYTGRGFSTSLSLPIAWCDKRQGPPPQLNGSLEDWFGEDALQEGPLVRMLSKPSVQRQSIELADKPSAIYSTWTDLNLYLGFRLEGADYPLTNSAASFISYDLGRAWREDACELLIQPVYDDNSVGPLLHVACKPHGQLETSRRLDTRAYANPWQAFAGTDIRYVATMDNATWRGEISIPWEALSDPQHPGKRPALLRFNFSQHRGLTGQSASWAGPVDYGRDDALMGLLVLRDPEK